MEREEFVFKKSWRDAICGLAIQVRMCLYEAIINYALLGTETELKGQARATFGFIKQEIDSINAYAERQQHLTEVRRRAGRKGAAVTNGMRKAAKDNLPTFAGNLPTFAENEKNPEKSSRTRIKDNQEFIDYVYNNKSKKKKENAEKKDKEIDAQAFITFYNQALAQAGAVIPHRCICTRRRADAIRARAREHGKASLREMVEKAAVSTFLNGGNNHAWVATLDWLLRPNNYVKVIEGNYDNNNFKANYDKTQQSDSRRGVAAGQHAADEY